MHHHCQSLPGRAFLQVKRLYPDIAFSWGTEGLGVPLLDILRKQTFLFKNEQERERRIRGIRQITGTQLPILFIKMQLRRLYSEKLSSVNQVARLQNTTGIKCKWSHFSHWQKPEGTENQKRGERVKFHLLIRKRKKKKAPENKLFGVKLPALLYPHTSFCGPHVVQKGNGKLSKDEGVRLEPRSG